MSSFPWADSGLFWRNKRAIVTGGGGFLGRFVVNHLAISWDPPHHTQNFQKLEIYEVRNGKIVAEYDGQYVASGHPSSPRGP